MINYGFNIDIGGNALKDISKIYDYSLKLQTAFEKLNKGIKINITGNFRNQLGHLNTLASASAKNLSKLDKTFSISVGGTGIQKIDRLIKSSNNLKRNLYNLKEKTNIDIQGNAENKLNTILNRANATNQIFRRIKASSKFNVTGNAHQKLSSLNSIASKTKVSLDKIKNKDLKFKLSGTGNVNRQISELNNNIKKTSSSVFTLKNALLGLGTLGVYNLGEKMFSSARISEESRIAFNTITGTPEKGGKLYQDLIDLASRTPLTVEQSLKGGKQLLGMGFNEASVVKDLEMLTTIAKGVGGDLSLIAHNYGQGLSKKQVDAIDIRQYATQGIPIRAVLTEMFKDTKQFKELGGIDKMVSAGMIGHEAIEYAFKSLTEEGGKFYGLLDKIAKTSVSGQWDILKGKMQLALIKTFESARPYIIKVIEQLKYLFDNFDKLTPAIDKFFERINIGNTWWGKLVLNMLGFNNEGKATKDIIDNISSALDKLGTVLSLYITYILPLTTLASVLRGIAASIVAVSTLGGVASVLGVGGLVGTTVGAGGAGFAGVIAGMSALTLGLAGLGAIILGIGTYKLIDNIDTSAKNKSYDTWTSSIGINNPLQKSLIESQVNPLRNLEGKLEGDNINKALSILQNNVNVSPLENDLIQDIKNSSNLCYVNDQLKGSWNRNKEDPFYKPKERGYAEFTKEQNKILEKKVDPQTLLQNAESLEKGTLRSGIGGKSKDFIIHFNAPLIKIEKVENANNKDTAEDLSKMIADNFFGILQEASLSI